MNLSGRKRALLVGLAICLLGSSPGAAQASNPATVTPDDTVDGKPRSAARLTDAEVERVLLEGRVIEIEEVGSGVTKPQKVRLDLEGTERQAIFKSSDVHLRGVTRLKGAPPEMNYSDSYFYDRAAYLLDRELGLNMVPVAMLRKIGGDDGAIVDWVTGAITEEDRLKKKIDIGPATRQQIAMMRVFDMLINNADRNLGNLLYTTDDWNVRLIDHGRGFRFSGDWPREYDDLRIRLPRDLLARLEALDRARLNELLAGLVGKDRVKALLRRRDKILKRVELERARSGDAYVFLETEE